MNISNKITVLLADDDQLILDDIINLISWEDLGFHIAAAAHNGKQALSLFKEHRPQIVITDIIMPLLDGIELITEIRKIDADVRFLILSSYDDFSYAKSAIRLGVSDYLLKPELSPDSLEMIMRKVSLEIMNVSVSRQDYNILKLADYFKYRNTDSSESYLLDSRQKKEHYFFFLCSLSSADKQRLLTDHMSLFLKTNAVTLSRSLELTSNDCIFYIDEFLVIGIAESKSPLSGQVRMWCNSIHTVFKVLNLSCSILYTPVSMTMAQYKKNYYINRNHYYYSVLFQAPPSLCIDEAAAGKPPVKYAVPDYDAFELMLKKEDGKQQLLDWADMIDLQKDYAGFQKLFKNICVHFGLNADEEFEDLNSMQAVKNWIMRNYENSNYLESSDIGKYSLHVRNAILYMKNHYVDSALSVEEIAENIGLSTGRLSVLFKKELSMTITEYLTNIRINAAIDLLSNSNDKIYEIAERVGYNSSQYFSRTFFNHTGRKPLDYRNNTFTKFTIGE